MSKTIRLQSTVPRVLWQFVLPLLSVCLAFAAGYGIGLAWPPAPVASCGAGFTTPSNPR